MGRGLGIRPHTPGGVDSYSVAFQLHQPETVGAGFVFLVCATDPRKVECHKAITAIPFVREGARANNAYKCTSRAIAIMVGQPCTRVADLNVSSVNSAGQFSHSIPQHLRFRPCSTVQSEQAVQCTHAVVVFVSVWNQQSSKSKGVLLFFKAMRCLETCIPSAHSGRRANQKYGMPRQARVPRSVRAGMNA